MKNKYSISNVLFLLFVLGFSANAAANPFCKEEFWESATRTNIVNALNQGHNFNDYCNDQKYKAGNFALARLRDPSFIDLLVQGQLDLNAKTESGRSVLHSALYSNEPSLLVNLIARGVDPNSPDNYGTTPLLLACAIADNRAIIEALVVMGANKHAKNDAGQTCFYEALKSNGRHEIIKYILEQQFPTEYEDCVRYSSSKDPCQPAISAYLGGFHFNFFGEEKTKISTDVLDLLISRGFDVNDVSLRAGYPGFEEDWFEGTAIRLAIRRHQDKGLIEYLLDNGANINQRRFFHGEFKGSTPIFDALNPQSGKPNHDLISFLVFKGAELNLHAGLRGSPLTTAIGEDLETVGLLLDLGADIEARDEQGRTALLYASSNGEFEAMEYLLARGANINAVTDLGQNVTHLAAQEQSVAVLKMLIAKGANYKKIDQEGRNLLHLAARSSLNPLMVRSLIQDFGFDVNSTTSNVYENGPLLLATIDNPVVGVMAELLRNGADPNYANANGYRPLHAAALRSSYQNVSDQPLRISLLLSAGARVNHQTSMDGTTALMFAAETGIQQSIIQLVKAGARPRIQNKKGQNALDIYNEKGWSKDSDYRGRGYWALHDQFFN